MTTECLPITNSIHAQFERSMTAVVNASDLRWSPGVWPKRFYIVGRECCFNYYSDIRQNGNLVAKIYRDSMGFEIVVDSN